VESFGWEDRAANLMTEAERNFVLDSLTPNGGEKDHHLAWLIQENVLPPADRIEDSTHVMTRGETVRYLSRVTQMFDDVFQSGAFNGLEKNSLKLQSETQIYEYPLSGDFFLMENEDGAPALAAQCSLIGGEEVRWVEREGSLCFLEILTPFRTNILDRSSSYRSWEVKRSKPELERRINRFYPVGRLIDLVVLKRGKSHRVVELIIQGSETSVVVDGLRIRSVLGLRDTLFVMEKKLDGEQRVSHYIFHGRGWGHGVGLCQIGAYGMAQADATYKEILKKYYTGVTIERRY
jgi:stage II sporulation protein D